MSKPILQIYLADLVHSIPGNYVVPLNIAYLSAYSKSIFKNELDISLFKSPDELLNAIKREAPDILGLSNYSWNYDLNYRIGNHVKTFSPSTIIIMGGPGIRTDRMGIKAFLQRNPYVDIYMMFEGEQPFVNFLNTVIELGEGSSWRSNRKEIKGCAYLTQDLQLIYSPCDQISDLDTIPSVYLGGYLDDFLKQGLIPLLETNRGCPFSCTFCTWGISALKKVRKFPLERAYDEMDYIVQINPNLPLWIVADANFGLFNRDELIAVKIKAIRDSHPSLRKVVVWASHNRSDMNLKIFNQLGNLERYLIAVQSFDPVVQKNVKLTNIKEDEIPNIIKKVKGMGVETVVDILLGLPGETKQSHLDTLRKSFDTGFDFIDAGNIRMLPGSELETDEQRRKYDIKTKYRLIQGSYGTYQGIRSLEAEESIRATSTMTEDDILYFRLIHWLIWFGWNTRFLAPLLKYLTTQGINPLDLIIEIVDSDKKQFALIDDLFNSFRKDAEEEWFATYDDLRSHYLEDQHFDRLLNGGFSKMNFKYMAELILNRPTYLAFIDFIKDVAVERFSSSCTIPLDIWGVMRENLIDADEVNRNSKISKKALNVCTDILPFIVPEDRLIEGCKGQFIKILFFKDDEHIKALRELYGKFDFNLNKHLAIEKILEYFIDGFTYNISVEEVKECK